jgi:hypothetical protein
MMSQFYELPRMIQARIMRLAVDSPERYAEERIPALSDRTIAETLAHEGEDGLRKVSRYLARLEEILGTKEPRGPIAPRHRRAE